MTALGKLLRTTAFKLTLVYLTVFALFAVFLLGYFAWNTRRLITEQITQTVDAEITGLAEQYRQGGIRRLVFVVDARSRRPGSSLYLVTTRAGEGLAGNVGSLSTGILETSGWTETAYRRLDDPDGAEHHALVRVFQLSAGFRLLVGRDLEERERLHDIVLAAGRWSLAVVIVLGVGGGFFVTRRLRNRCEEALRVAEDESQYRGALESTIEESEALIRTFNALLMIARAESGQARDGMTECDAAEIARGVGELYEPLADDKGIHLKVEAPAAAPVHGNRELISQALANLVDNAIKYGSGMNGADAQIVVTAKGEGDRILLAVADSGRGIPVTDRDRAVERFVRLEQSRSQPGSGLGLSLASAVARLHGGELKLEDNHPGLKTVISLPRAGSAPPA